LLKKKLSRAKDTSPLFLGRLAFFEQVPNVISDNAPAHTKHIFFQQTPMSPLTGDTIRG
jgi:hypothetical protein